ncbi:unnamed protein product [Nezara viridula]|uniref:Uncharacterized protein n=1 Tax=Nezara viridula TaxID=85310 RepID=A0A9P0HV68_NEZVI|nr:unnamed protein product [Nezara viridula]
MKFSYKNSSIEDLDARMRCSYLLGEGNQNCQMFEKCYKCLCPHEWVNTWNEQIENGTFPRDLTKEMGK